MRGIHVTGLAISVAALLLAVASSDAQAQGSLDGHGYGVQSTMGDLTYPDHLVFDGNTFESMGCRPYGFTPTTYTATQEGDTIAFNAVATSPTEGTMTWEGRVTGDQIAGTAVWTKEGQDPITMPFSGQTAAGPLDGRQYQVTSTDPSQTEPDTLTFALGAFESLSCREYGFFPVTYTAEASDDGVVTFAATAFSETEGTMTWTGTVNGGAIEGTAVWTKEGQDPMTLPFSGAVQTARADN